MKVAVIIPAAGAGKRLPGKIAKQYLEIHGKPIINWTVHRFLSMDIISRGILVVPQDEVDRTWQLFSNDQNFKKKFDVIIGGNHRQDSVFNGLAQLNDTMDLVLVHDGVRPLVSREIIMESIRVANESGACIVAVPVKDTVKRVQDNHVLETIPREQVWQVQTPQTFRYEILYHAHQQARQMKYYATDEAALLEWLGIPIAVIRGDYRNIKITTREDMIIAEALWAEALWNDRSL
jgi:2-C-methyl-D-erythritol 4-phosphate cytidylyltransferase